MHRHVNMGSKCGQRVAVRVCPAKKEKQACETGGCAGTA